MIERITAEFGPIKQEFLNSNWEAPTQYKEEMGDGIQASILILANRLSKSKISELKSFLVMLENEFSGDKRVFNLNPGYLSSEGFFLLSRKLNQARGRIPFSDMYWQEKQLDVSSGVLSVMENSFDELNHLPFLEYLHSNLG